MAASELEREVRKRRERRDSGCAGAHERKERRPHSEERAPPPPPTPPLHDANRLEMERRAERLSRARRPQHGKRRRGGPRPRSHKENDCSVLDEPSAPSPPPLDLAALHRQLGDGEPARSWAILSTHQTESEACDERYCSTPRSPPPVALSLQLQTEKRLEKIKKKIHTLKKNIAEYESEWEKTRGCSITPVERDRDIHISRLYDAVKRLQTEKKCIKTDPAEYALKLEAARVQKDRDDKLDAALRSDKSMVEVVQDIEEWLVACRIAAGRTGAPSQWSFAQLTAEKSCVQRALLRLEAARGRPPARSVERGVARPLYDRYRAAKRALVNRTLSMGALNGELATILEHETMLFPATSIDSSSDSQPTSANTSEVSINKSPPKEGEEPASSSSASEDQAATADFLNVPSNESLHCLSIPELTNILTETKQQKTILRRTIKEYELGFELQNARKVQKDDKKGFEDDYSKYKAIKARIRLINALINKQKAGVGFSNAEKEQY